MSPAAEHVSSPELAGASVGTAQLVVQTSFLGDVVLTTPLLATLARRGAVDVVTTPAAAPLLVSHPAVRSVIAYDKRGANRGATGFLRLARRLARTGYAVAYHAQGSWRSAALTLAAGIRERVGFDTSDGRVLYTTRISYRADRHHAERLWQLAEEPAGATPPPPRLHPGEDDRLAVDALLGMEPSHRPLAVLAPGSIWATKRWPYYADLAARLAPDARLAIIGAGADSALADEIVARIPTSPAVLNAVGRLSLLGSAELLRRAAVLITNDSAPQHLASAVGTPTITIFGPTVPAFGFGPLAPRSLTIGHETLPCRPCDRHGPRECPLGHWRCMREVTPEQVAIAAAPFLALASAALPSHDHPE